MSKVSLLIRKIVREELEMALAPIKESLRENTVVRPNNSLKEELSSPIPKAKIQRHKSFLTDLMEGIDESDPFGEKKAQLGIQAEDIPESNSALSAVKSALTRDYSQLLKKMESNKKI